MWTSPHSCYQEGSHSFHAQSSIQAEAIAIREAIRHAKEEKLLHITSESDCLQVVTHLAGRSTTDKSLHFVLVDIKNLLPFFIVLIFRIFLEPSIGRLMTWPTRHENCSPQFTLVKK